MRGQRVKKIAYHRNGVGGLGFHVAIVEDTFDRAEKRDMLVIRFDKRADQETGGTVCAAFDLAELAKGVIEFGENSWRGDYYHETIDDYLDLTKRASDMHRDL